MLPFQDWRPDLTPFKGAGTSTIIQNVVPRGDGYGPFQDFVTFTDQLASGNDSFTKILLQMDGTNGSTTFTDSNAGGSAHTWTPVGSAQISTAQSKFGGASGLFNGTTDYISTPDSVDFTLGGSNFTIDCWFNCNAPLGTFRSIFGQCEAAQTAALSTIYILRDNAAGVLNLFVSNGTSIFAVIGTTVFSNTINPGWHHLAAVVAGNTMKLFIDGIQEGPTAAFTGTVNNGATPMTVGRMGDAPGTLWSGWIDAFRMSVGIARWTANFTPPGTAYGISQACRGFFYARKTDGSIAVFAGTATKLYQLNNTNFTWTDVSKGLGSYGTLPNTDHWQFAQFGNFVIAVQANVVPQVFNISSSSQFADLAGPPPQARYIAVVGRFVVLSGLLSTPFRIQWSGLNDPTNWTSGVNSSDFQDFPDGGIVRGVAGGEYGVIFQETAMRRMIFVAGDLVFQIERITEDKGLMAPYSLIRAANKIFFLAPQGFHAMDSTGVPVPIGKERFDRTFFGDFDSGSLQLIIGAADPAAPRVYWAYKSQAGSTGLFDKLLCYDYALDRASVVSMSGEYIASLARPGQTLESLDTISSSIDALPFSLDDVAIASLAKLSMVGPTHMLGFFAGPNLEATIDSSEQTLDGTRARVKGFRPITDAANCVGSVGARENVQSAVTYSTEQAVNSKGLCPANVSTRLARGRLRIPSGSVWTFASGIEPTFTQEGRR